MFVGRRPDGTVYGTWTNRQPNDEFHPGIEELEDEHPDVTTFRHRPFPVVQDPLDAKIASLQARLEVLESKIA